MLLYPNELVIGDDNFDKHFANPVVNGKQMGKGLIPRDYGTHPQGFYKSAPPFSIHDMPIIPREEWSERIEEMERTKTRLSDIRMKGNSGQPIPSLDQNGQGFCWFYSGTGCVTILRAVNNQPYVPLSAHSGACVIKNFRDQGGWGAAGLDFLRDRGVVPQSLWPAKSMSRSYDTPEAWDAAKEFRVTEGWVDLTPAAYDRNMSFDQQMTCLLNRIPLIGDYNHMGHSMCVVDPVEVDKRLSLEDPNRWGVRPWNSWTDGWGSLGMFVLKGRKAVADGCSAPRAVWGN